MAPKVVPPAEERIDQLKTVGKFTEGFQILVLLVMGQNIFASGETTLRGKHWQPVADFFGGYQNVGISLIAIGLIGLAGMATLALTDTDEIYRGIMWVFSIAAAVWFWFVGSWHGWAALNIPGAGNTGFWTLGLAGAFFISSRIAISIGTNPYEKETTP